MSDISDSLMNNDDLLDILNEADEGETPNDDIEKDDVEEGASKKLEELREIASQMSSTEGEVVSNPGSGDIDKDIEDWFKGDVSLPSDDLNQYVGNSHSKMDYGLTRQTLSNIEMLGKLRSFLDSSIELLFSESALVGLDPEDALDRTKVGFAMYKELASLNQRTIMGIKDYRMKAGSDADELDKVSMLLASIPNDKLKTLLQELNDK